ETGQHVAAVNLVGLTQTAGAAVGPIDAGGAGLGIDHPDQRHADVKVFADLHIDLVVQIVGRDDLDGKIGPYQDVASGDAFAGQTAEADERDVRLANEFQSP